MARLDTTNEQHAVSFPAFMWRRLDKIKKTDAAGRSISRIIADWLREMPEIAADIAEHENDKTGQ